MASIQPTFHTGPGGGFAAPTPASDRLATAQRWLGWSATGWASVAAIGQWLFVVYILGFYLRTLLMGDMTAWNKVLPEGHVPGDVVGNLAVMVHILLAAVVTGGGAVQLVPVIRRRWPRLHRWNGRIYLTAVVLVVGAGVYMTLSREGGLDVMRMGILLNAVVVLACAAMALRHALARRIDLHRRWALRLFLAASAVWFFRIGLMAWLITNGGPVGFDPKTFTGPFLVFLSYAQTLLPLAVLEAYLRACDGRSVVAKRVMSVGLVGLTMLTGLGIFGASMMLWLPRL